ncbi:MAG: hypothetical protein QXK95_00470 [Nitrososphaerota archaeon]
MLHSSPKIHIVMITLLVVMAISPFLIVLGQEEGNKVTLTFYMYTELGDKRLLCRNVVAPGEETSCSIQYPIMEFGNNTRVVFTGWYNGSRYMSSSHELRVIAGNTSQEYTAFYRAQYLVELDLGYQELREWVYRRSRFTYTVPEIINIEEGVRRVFSHWAGDIESSNPSISIAEVLRPINARVFWKTQYYVEVISDHPLSVKSGWYFEEDELELKPQVNPIILNDGETKIVLENFQIDYPPKGSVDKTILADTIKIKINKTMTIVASWNKYHHVLIESQYISPKLYDGWIKHGEKIQYELKQPEEIFNNYTKIVFNGWSGDISNNNPRIDLLVEKPLKIHALWKVFYYVSISSEYDIKISKSEWVEKGESIYIDANPTARIIRDDVRAIFTEWVGSYVTANSTISVKNLDKPLILKATWIREYKVKIDAPENSGLEKEVWIREGESLDLDAPTIILIDNYTRLVFSSWSGCSIVERNHCTLTNINSPVLVKANYYLEKKILLEAVSLEYEPVKNVVFTIKNQYEKVEEVNSGSEVWLRTGVWKVLKSEWEGYNVLNMDEFEVKEDENLRKIQISTTLFKITFIVSDYLGLPVKDAEITIKTADGKIKYSAKTDDEGRSPPIGPPPPSNITIEISHLWFHETGNLDLMRGGIRYVTIPLSQMSLQALTIGIAITLSTTTFLIVRASRRSRRLPIPRPPITEILEPEAQEEIIEAIRKAPKVTLEDVIKKLESSGEDVEKLLGEISKEVREKKEKETKSKQTSKKKSKD